MQHTTATLSALLAALSAAFVYLSPEVRRVQRAAQAAGYTLHKQGKQWVLVPSTRSPNLGQADLFNGSTVCAAFDTLGQAAYHARYCPASYA